jgi:hypothetical protein
MKKVKLSLFLLLFLNFFIISSTFNLITPISSHTDARRECLEFNESETFVTANPFIDGIPPIDNPKFFTANEYENSNYFDGDTRVLGIVVNGIARAYPIDILDYHEIVNDVIDGQHVSITYCPLTGSGLPFLTSEMADTTFGTTGFLYENNLIFYDRETVTYWSQMSNSFWCSEIEHKVRSFPTIPVIETTWNAWRNIHPNSEVLTRDTGYIRNYDAPNYGNYYETSDIYFPSQYWMGKDPLYAKFDFHNKEQTLILPDFNTYRSSLFPYSELEKSPVINWEAINETSVVVVYDNENLLATSFSAKLTNGSILEFLSDVYHNEIANDFGLITFKDTSGSVWNMKGEAIDGSLKGEILLPHFSYTAYWFAALSFFPESTVFISPNNDSLNETTFSSAFTSETINPADTETLDFGGEFFLGLALITVISIRISKKKQV